MLFGLRLHFLKLKIQQTPCSGWCLGTLMFGIPFLFSYPSEVVYNLHNQNCAAQRIHLLPSVTLGKDSSLPSVALGKALFAEFHSFAECIDHGTRQSTCFAEFLFFAEYFLVGTRLRRFCRVSDIMHSAKSQTLGKADFSSSECKWT
jgi:hypothetical protein